MKPRRSSARRGLFLWTGVLLLVLVEGIGQPVRSPGDVGERAVLAVEIELDRSDALCDSSCVLGFVEHPSIRQHEEYALLSIGHRIADRLAGCCDDVRHVDARCALDKVPLESDRLELRVLDDFNDRREDLKHCADFLVRTGHNVEESIPLRLVGALVDDRLKDAVAVMHGAGKVERANDRQAVEVHSLAVALVDLERHEPSAPPSGWVRHCLARAAEIAAAILHILAFDSPITSGHVHPPLQIGGDLETPTQLSSTANAAE